MVPSLSRPLAATFLGVLAAILLSLSPLHPRSAVSDLPRPAEGQGTVQDERETNLRGRVGQIFVIGNTMTPTALVLSRMPFKEGDKFSQADLRIAEQNLARLRIFADDPAPEVRVLENDNEDGNSPRKDILVCVCERPYCLYFWAFEESLEFADIWVTRGLPIAMARIHSDAFPNELILFALTGEKSSCPYVISQFFTK